MPSCGDDAGLRTGYSVSERFIIIAGAGPPVAPYARSYPHRRAARRNDPGREARPTHHDGSGYAVTGPVIAGDSTEAIRAGTIGNLLNMVGAEQVREMQRLAVEESRLGIPLLIGFDVVHGHRTCFRCRWPRRGHSIRSCGSSPRASRRAKPRPTASRWPSRRCWTSRAIRAGAAAPRGRARTLGRRALSPRRKVRGLQGRDLGAADALAAVAKHYLRLRRGHRRARLCLRRHVRAQPARGIHAAFRGCRGAQASPAVMPAFTDLAGVPMTANARCSAGGCAGGSASMA